MIERDARSSAVMRDLQHLRTWGMTDEQAITLQDYISNVMEMLSGSRVAMCGFLMTASLDGVPVDIDFSEVLKRRAKIGDFSHRFSFEELQRRCITAMVWKLRETFRGENESSGADG